MANTKVTGDLIAGLTIATGNIADNAVTSDKISGITTAHITEGSNLYYTDARADARITAATTSDLTEGTNLYYTDARADARTALLVDSAPSTLDTLNELAAALGDDPNFATTVTNSIATKMPIAGGTFTGNVSVNGEARVYTGSNLGYWGVDAGNSYVYLGTNSSAYGLSLQTGGIDRVNINDAGNVFISTPITNAFYGLSLTYNNTNTADFTVNQATGQIKIGGVAAGYFPTFYSAGVERMRINSSGDVGIGYTGPYNQISGGETTLAIADADNASLYLKSNATGGHNHILFSGTGGSLSFYDKTRGDYSMIISNSGDVGIGTTSPFSAAKLDVNGNIYAKAAAATIDVVAYNTTSGLTDADLHLAATSSGEGQVRMYGNYPLTFYTNNAERMRITDIGQIGMGITSPVSNLQVYSTAATNSYSTTITKNGNMAAGLSISVLDNVNSMTGIFFSTGGSTHWSGITGSRTDESAHWGTQLNFYTHNNDVTALNDATQKMVIKGDGNVGIGTTSPDAKLEIATLRQPGIRLSSLDTTAATNELLSGIEFYTPDISAPRVSSYINCNFTSAYGDSYLTFATSTGVGAATERMRIDSDGQVQVRNRGGGGADLILYNTDTSIGTNQMIGRLGFYKSDASGSGVGVSSSIQVRSDSSIGGKSFMSFHTDDGTLEQERMRITSGGDVLINLTGPITSRYSTSIGTTLASGYSWFASNDSLYVQRPDGTNGNAISFFRASVSTGSISLSGSATAYNTSSDYRLKEDLQDFAGLDMVSKIPVYDFKWKTEESRSYGVMAHELQEVLPDGVSGEKDAEEMQGVDYSKIVPLLIKAIQELKAEIEILKNK